MEELYGEIVKQFSIVIHQIRLYSPNHPTAQVAVRNLTAKIDEGFSSETHIAFGPAEGLLIVNDCPLDNKKTGVSVLLTECRRLEIERLILERGMDGDELVSLLNLMALPPKILQEKGGFKETPIFALQIPKECPGVPKELLDPSKAWDDPKAYDLKAQELAKRFEVEFKRHG